MSDQVSDQGAAPAGQPIRRSPRWMKALLIVSLAINLAVAGFAISRVIAGPKFMAAGPGASLMDARKLLWTLPREERHALRDEFMDRHHDEFMTDRARWHDARLALADTLGRPDASDEDIRAAYRHLGEIEAEAAVRWREVLGEMTIQIAPSDRAVFAGRMRHGHGRGGWWHGRGRDDDDD